MDVARRQVRTAFRRPKRIRMEDMAQQAATVPLPPERDPAQAPTGGRAERRPVLKRSYGALDLGTNNCRLLIARPAENGFVVIDAFSRVVRLGEGLATRGRIADDAIERAVGALAVCAEKLRRRRVSLSRSVATEACRRRSEERR